MAEIGKQTATELIPTNEMVGDVESNFEFGTIMFDRRRCKHDLPLICLSC